MRFLQFVRRGRHGIAVEKSGSIHGLTSDQESYPGSLKEVLAGGSDVLRSVATDLLQEGEELDPQSITFLPPVDRPDKIVCVGLNYQDHTSETDYKQPDYPALFARFSSSLVGHDSAIVRPQASDTLDYEGELAVVIGGAGRHIPLPQALSHVAGYSIFNDGSVREYQHKTPQWTVGKNFDGTGAFGPVLVTSDELPGGARGLSIETRLNGNVVQSSNTDRLISMSLR